MNPYLFHSVVYLICFSLTCVNYSPLVGIVYPEKRMLSAIGLAADAWLIVMFSNPCPAKSIDEGVTV